MPDRLFVNRVGIYFFALQIVIGYLFTFSGFFTKSLIISFEILVRGVILASVVNIFIIFSVVVHECRLMKLSKIIMPESDAQTHLIYFQFI